MEIRKIVLCLVIITLAGMGTACSRNISDQKEKADMIQGKDEDQVNESGGASRWEKGQRYLILRWILP